VREVDPGALPALLGPDRSELARILPEIRSRSVRLDPGTVDADPPRRDHDADDRFAQVRLFELVLGVVERLAKAAPLVLVIEDIQWADPSTLDLLAFLVRNLRDDRVLILMTIRTDEFGPRHPVMAYVSELERGEAVDRIDLQRLDRDELARLVADELGHRPDAHLLERTWERSGGNPFHAEQLIAATREVDGGDLPPRLRDVLLARVAHVSEAGQEVLRVASAAGTRIDDDLLIAVAELPATVVREALHEVVDRRILMAAGGPRDPHFVFRHALLQEVIHAELFPGERARRHAGYAIALEARVADRTAGRTTIGPLPTPAELAYHWDAAGDDRRALAATIEAGRAAERGFAWLEAHRDYLRALELWARVEDAGLELPADRTEVLARTAETAVLIGEYRTAVDLGREAIASIDASVDPARAAALQERQRWFLWEAGDRVAAAAAVAEAERLIPVDPPSAARARILAQHAGILMFSARFGDSVPIAEEALAVARSVGSAANEALALGILGWDLALMGRVDEGIERIRAGIAIAESLRGAEGIALGATNLALLLDRVGRTPEALDVAIAGWEQVRSLGVERTYGGLLLAVAAKAAFALGRWDDADGFLLRGLGREPVGSPGIRLRVQRGRLDTARGAIPAATAALGAARAADEAAGGTDDRAAILSALADLAAAQGRITETRAAVDEGSRMASDAPPDPALALLAATGLRVEADVAEVARHRHDDAGLAEARRRAGRIVHEVERFTEMFGVVVGADDGAAVAPSRNAAESALCREEARRVDGRDRFVGWSRVADAWEAIDRPYPAAYARYRAAGAILRERGDRADARTALARARGTTVRLGALPLTEAIERLSRQARLDLGPVGPVGVGGPPSDAATDTVAALGLTERELEVLHLLAAGWSNQEIADSLFITRKTASVHASHIFDKLGARDRVEAASIAHRLGLAGDAPPPPGSAATG